MRIYWKLREQMKAQINLRIQAVGNERQQDHNQ